MQFVPPFSCGKAYALAGKKVQCVQLTRYGGKLSGVQKAYLRSTDNPKEEFTVVRYPDGAVMRVHRQVVAH